MTCLAVITARGGSKGLPGKNVMPFAGKPLIYWTIAAAKSSGEIIDSLVLSTDSAEIAEVARQYGCEVPFLRPDELAKDETPSLPVIQHAVEAVEKDRGIRFDWVLLLQPTSPLRLSTDIIAAFDVIKKAPDTTAVISVTEAQHSHPLKLKRIVDGKLYPFYGERFEQIRRQDLEPVAYNTNGAIYLTRRDILIEDNDFYGSCPRPLPMPAVRSLDIDDQSDLVIAEAVFYHLALDGHG